jgi:DNA-binding transcriptional ArsR family regulator
VPGRPDPRVELLTLLADPTRFAILEHLERGPASASELARHVGASPTRLANHLRRLREAGLVEVRHEVRLAIYALAEPGLREIFSMLNGLRGAPVRPLADPPLARTCYDHLAGRVGVGLFEHLVASGALEAREGEGELRLGPGAAGAFGRLGVALDAAPPPGRRLAAYACLDSGVGRAHLGGWLGARLAGALRERGWLRPGAEPRGLELTAAGRRGLRGLGVEL